MAELKLDTAGKLRLMICAGPFETECHGLSGNPPSLFSGSSESVVHHLESCRLETTQMSWKMVPFVTAFS